MSVMNVINGKKQGCYCEYKRDYEKIAAEKYQTFKMTNGNFKFSCANSDILPIQNALDNIYVNTREYHHTGPAGLYFRWKFWLRSLKKKKK